MKLPRQTHRPGLTEEDREWLGWFAIYCLMLGLLGGLGAVAVLWIMGLL